ncbi:2-hydroxyacyl-CoA dehydratase family protein [Anaerovoracaceae bacterium 41-7]|uniref:2-hydroxyacyl-CoA dehydratase n=1 Tax=Anaerotruncus colihominis TaxID=169435 RepID=A0A845QMD3_9FIRM|nr:MULTISPECIES: 2-hydroxyacyl-CoA dehydratase family protein [Clostridia]MCI9639110.1 2-hydroxyacyl-CoA dehydratase [Emergencia sp.]NBH62335.1 2-hydroxyacyl-CoA dehydratase [Anaerotruncus colihominis]NCE99472.1 2-hydroxyacyl-CoA dehydratase [Emergencia sp. 1XD21-10]NCF02990.1 2-hydroxyacyl-CoA dehydratase [Anaerotruncus sp. 80]
MSKEAGGRKLGSLYDGKKARKRREWRGFKDTWYAYTQWLKIWKVLIKFAAKPRNIKGFFRYRWMLNFLAVPDFFDRHTEGMRDVQLRMAHTGLGLIVTDMCEMVETIFKADPRIGNDKALSDRIVIFDENMMSEIMNGFPNLRWLSVEVPSIYTSAMMNQTGVSHYIDVTSRFGIPGDVCPMPAAELGLAIDDDFPLIGKCAVQCNTTCDGSAMGNGIEAMRFNIPTFQLAVPIRHTQESVQDYAADEIKNCIRFIEENTGETFDWNAFFASMKTFNAESELTKEWLEMSRTPYPQVIGDNLALYRYGVYQAAGGRNMEFLETDRKITALAQEGYAKKLPVAKEVRHRAITWGVQAAYYTAFPIWLQNCWGIAALADMLSLVSMEPIDTEDPEKAIYDLAHLYENMIMRNRSNGGYEVGVEALWRYCEYFNCDMVIMYAHMGCKAMSGYHGIFEEEARKRGIHLIWVTHGLMKPEDASRQDMRTEVNRYMRTVLREEPVDPTLEEFDDAKCW